MLILDDLVDAVTDRLEQSDKEQHETVDGVPIISGTFGTFRAGTEPPARK